jgi:hypothetical protein
MNYRDFDACVEMNRPGGLPDWKEESMKYIVIALALSIFAALSPAKADEFSIDWSINNPDGSLSGSCSFTDFSFSGC